MVVEFLLLRYNVIGVRPLYARYDGLTTVPNSVNNVSHKPAEKKYVVPAVRMRGDVGEDRALLNKSKRGCSDGDRARYYRWGDDYV